ncbi:hypothetical protein D9619_002249 [Psilocybe cf. subviscida]|uniref:Uncharacterized protein n=1 Tax=Psilocybe cf. subviscida TaxID=2480587 RepID=A0A8H5F2W9_9AGAR|nr:hypothetical protein D9619_002249 [Psilocybe cf. subviscida]
MYRQRPPAPPTRLTLLPRTTPTREQALLQGHTSSTFSFARNAQASTAAVGGVLEHSAPLVEYPCWCDGKYRVESERAVVVVIGSHFDLPGTSSDDASDCGSIGDPPSAGARRRACPRSAYHEASDSTHI